MTYKTARLNIKVLDSDKNALRQWAKSEGEAVSVLDRQILREELKRRGFLPLIQSVGSESYSITHKKNLQSNKQEKQKCISI